MLTFKNLIGTKTGEHAPIEDASCLRSNSCNTVNIEYFFFNLSSAYHPTDRSCTFTDSNNDLLRGPSPRRPDTVGERHHNYSRSIRQDDDGDSEHTKVVCERHANRLDCMYGDRGGYCHFGVGIPIGRNKGDNQLPLVDGNDLKPRCIWSYNATVWRSDKRHL